MTTMALLPRLSIRAGLRRVWQHRWVRVTGRVIAIWHLAGAVAIIAAAPAWADSEAPADNAVFSWMDLKDSHGISVWRYFMSIDGGSASSPGKAVFSVLIKLEYEIYRAIVACSIWLIGWALSFEWLDLLIEPVRPLGDALQNLVGQLHLTPALLTISAFVGGLWMLRGKWAGGIYEILMSATMAALAAGVLSNPIDHVAGPDGLLMETRDAGVQIAAALANNGNTAASPDAMLRQIQVTLVDTLLRQPTQILNFGRVIDATGDQGCIEAWDRGHDDGTTRDTLKDNIRDCEGGSGDFLSSAGEFLGVIENGGPMKAYADNPGAEQFGAALFMIAGGFVVCVFGVLFAIAMIVAAATMLISAVKAIPGMLAAIAPGPGRDAIWMTAANVVMHVVIMLFAIVFLVAYMIVLQSFFGTGGDNVFKKFFFVDIALVVGVVVFRRGVKALKGAASGLAAKFGTRPGGGGPSSLSRSTPNAGMRMWEKAQTVGAVAAAGRGVVKAGRTTVNAGLKTGKAAYVTGRGAYKAAAVIGTGGAAAAVLAAQGTQWAGRQFRKIPPALVDGASGGVPRNLLVQAAEQEAHRKRVAALTRPPRRESKSRPGIQRTPATAPAVELGVLLNSLGRPMPGPLVSPAAVRRLPVRPAPGDLSKR